MRLMSKHRFIALICLGVLAGGVVMWASQVGSAGTPTIATPLGGAQVAALDGSAGAPATLPSDLAAQLEAYPELDQGSARLLQVFEGQTLYAFRSNQAPDRFCAAAARRAPDGSYASVSCGPTKLIASGKFLLKLETRNGGRGTPSVYFGLVPDGFVSVQTPAGSVPIQANSFAFLKEDGGAAGTLEYQPSTGAAIAVDSAP